MPRFLIGLVAGLGLAATAIVPAAAQTIPSGSYQQSCTNIRVRGDQLIARCTNPQGVAVRSSISLDSCRRGDIVNSNGQLACNRNGYGRRNGGGYYNGGYNNGGYNNGGYNNGRYGYGAPGGSYRGSCTNVQMNGSVLTATCTAPNGANITSSIDAARCRGGDIANSNGRLQCR